MGEMPYGTCEKCGKEGPLFIRYRHYHGIKCTCHSYPHFDRIELCEDCFKLNDHEVFPKHTKIYVHDKNKYKEVSIIVDADVLTAIGLSKLLNEN